MSHVGAPSATSINPGPATSRLPRYDREYFRRLLGKSFGSFALMGLHEERTERRSVPNGVLARGTISAVARIVDPSPIIEQRLIEVAAEYEPRLAVLRESIDSESARRARQGLKRSLRRTKREYRRARREVESLRIAWW